METNIVKKKIHCHLASPSIVLRTSLNSVGLFLSVVLRTSFGAMHFIDNQ